MTLGVSCRALPTTFVAIVPTVTSKAGMMSMGTTSMLMIVRRSRSKSRAVIRYQNTEGGRHRRDWTSMDAPRLLHQCHRATTILISPPSCGGRTTDVCYNSDDQKGPGFPSRGLCLWR